MYQDDNSLATGYMIGADRNNGYGNGFFGGDWAWILILALIFGWGNNGYGFGGFGGGNGFVGYDVGKLATSNDVAVGFAQNATLNSLNDLKLGQAGLQQTLCQGFNGVNTSILTSSNALQSQLADCCCDLKSGISDLRYTMAQDTCTITNAINNAARDIVDNQNANYRAIHDELVANKLEAKNERIAELTQQVNALNLAQSQANQNAYLTATMDANTAELIRRLGRDYPTPSYIVPNPNCCYQSSFNSCGCNSCC